MRHLYRSSICILICFILLVVCASDEEKKKAHLKKGEAYFDKGEYESAELEFRNAIQIDPEFVDAYLKLGETYLKLGKPQNAFREYRMVAQLDPDNRDALLKLATFYMLGRKIDEAVKMTGIQIEKPFILLYFSWTGNLTRFWIGVR